MRGTDEQLRIKIELNTFKWVNQKSSEINKGERKQQSVGHNQDKWKKQNHRSADIFQS
jgi:hypothetical protein